MPDAGALPALAVKAAVKHHKTLAMAFFEAQTEFGEIIADGLNAEKGYRWRTFKAIREALAPILHKNGLAFSQAPDDVDTHQDRSLLMLKTTILHAKSGAEMTGRYPVCDARCDAHIKATCLTLARRYSLVSIMGVSAETEEDEPPHRAANPDPDGIDQRPEDERPLLAGPGLGAIKDQLVEDWTARMRASTATEDVDAILAEAESYPGGRFSDNVVDGLRIIAQEERDRIAVGAAPAVILPSPFEALQAEGLACAKVETNDEAIGAYARWLSRVNSKTKIALCSPEEREALKALKRSVKSEIDSRLKLKSAAVHPGAAEGGAPESADEPIVSGGSGAPSPSQPETETTS